MEPSAPGSVFWVLSSGLIIEPKTQNTKPKTTGPGAYAAGPSSPGNVGSWAAARSALCLRP